MTARDRDTGQMRLVGAVIAATVLAWLAVNMAGQAYGWPAKYAFLADLMAMGALIWSLAVTWRLWKRRQG